MSEYEFPNYVFSNVPKIGGELTVNFDYKFIKKNPWRTPGAMDKLIEYDLIRHYSGTGVNYWPPTEIKR